MLTESIGGKCPICGYTKMFLRYGSVYYYKFDACPNCSFAFAHNDYDIVEKGQDVWDAIIDMYGYELDRLKLPRTIEGLKQWLENTDDGKPDLEGGTVWCYDNHNLKSPAYFAYPMKKVRKITDARKVNEVE